VAGFWSDIVDGVLRMRCMVRVVPLLVLALFASPSVSSAAVVGTWELNESGGTRVVDSSGRHNGGTSRDISFRVAGAYTFNGSTSKVTMPAAPSLVPGSRDVALFSRFRSGVTAGGKGDFDWDMVKKGGYKIEIYRKNGKDQARCSFTAPGGQKIAFQDGPSLTDGSWHTVSCTKNASGVTLRVDGVAYRRSGALGTIRPGRQLWIGWGGDNTDFFHGDLDYVKVSIG
jgi:hypothetical protein